MGSSLGPVLFAQVWKRLHRFLVSLRLSLSFDSHVFKIGYKEMYNRLQGDVQWFWQSFHAHY